MANATCDGEVEFVRRRVHDHGGVLQMIAWLREAYGAALAVQVIRSVWRRSGGGRHRRASGRARFQISLLGEPLLGFLGENGEYRASRRLPPDDQCVIGPHFADALATTPSRWQAGGQFSTTARRVVLHRLAVRFGLPRFPKGEGLERILNDRMLEELLGFNCSPVAIKGTKLRMLRILSTGIKRKLIAVPAEVSPPLLPLEAS